MTQLDFEDDFKQSLEISMIGNDNIGVILEQNEARIGILSFKWSFLEVQNYKNSSRTYGPCDKLAIWEIPKILILRGEFHWFENTP